MDNFTPTVTISLQEYADLKKCYQTYNNNVWKSIRLDMLKLCKTWHRNDHDSYNEANKLANSIADRLLKKWYQVSND